MGRNKKKPGRTFGKPRINVKKDKKPVTTPRISDFDGRLLTNQNRTEMKVNGVTATFNMPDALPREIDPHTGEEKVHQLPPHATRAAFVVDEYPACPETWMHGSDKAASYFVPIEAGKGMWLDLTKNITHTHHIAAVISVQGINPLTGKKTDVIRLEQYKEKCPVHDIAFGQDLFCKECKHKWPAQNYLSTNNGGQFWLDGFVASDGQVRQWMFTEEEMKGVAAQIIKQDRVFAIGIALYKAKAPKPVYTPPVYRRFSGVGGQSAGGKGFNKFYSMNYCDTGATNEAVACSAGPTGPTGLPGLEGVTLSGGNSGSTTGTSGTMSCAGAGADLMDRFADYETMGEYPDISSANHYHANDGSRGLEAEEKTSGGITLPDDARGSRGRRTRGSTKSLPAKSIKKLEVGAGARINQEIHRDPEALSFWEDEPLGFIYINYCSEEDAKRIIAEGKREESKEGFLADVKLAN